MATDGSSIAEPASPLPSLPSLRVSFERAASLTGSLHTPFEVPQVDPYDEVLLSLPEAAAEAPETVPLLVEAPPHSWKDALDETSRLLALAVPLMVQSLSSMLLNIISITFVGHLNSGLELSAIVLANSVYNVTGYSIIIGISSAMDTLCGQAYGAKQYRMLGVLRQRAQVILWTLCIPIVALWTQSGRILLLLGQQPELVQLTSRVLMLMAPGLFVAVVNDTLRRYLLAQRIARPGMVCFLVTVALSPLYNWFFVYRLGWRTAGAAVAFVACQVTLAAQISLYTCYRDFRLLHGKPEQTWHGWSLKEAFSGWSTYLAYGLPAAAMICFEWWLWEVMIILAGLLPTAATAVGVMGISMQISGFSYMIPSSFGSAAAVRVSNLLGAGIASSARMVANISVSVVAVVMLVLAGIAWAARSWVVYVFTHEPNVTAMTEQVLPAVVVSMWGDGLVAVLSGVLRGCGRQGIGAALNLAGYWCLGLPLAYVLGFKADLQILGFWTALAVATLVQAGIFSLVLCRIDWKLEVRRAHAITSKSVPAKDGYVPIDHDEEAGGGTSHGIDDGDAEGDNVVDSMANGADRRLQASWRPDPGDDSHKEPLLA